MLIHLGERKSIFTKDIIAIIDLNNNYARKTFDDPEANDPNMKSCLVTKNERVYNGFMAITLAERSWHVYTSVDKNGIKAG